jgi:DNA-binding XRE family transcriptional regulator
MYLRGVLDNAHFHRMRKVTIQLLYTQEKLGRYIVINSQSYLSKVN